MNKQSKAPTSSTERVRRYRNRIRKDGWTVTTVRIPADQVDALRAYAKTLGQPKPKPQSNKNQLALFPDYE